MVAEVNDVQVPIDPDDDERNEVDSDNELGPEEVDEDDDAMPPDRATGRLSRVCGGAR